MTASTDLCGGTFEQKAKTNGANWLVHWLVASPHADAPSKNKTHLKMMVNVKEGNLVDICDCKG